MFPRALVLAMLGALGAPAAAFGATASVATETGSTPVAHGPPLTELRSTYSYVAGPGEQNQPALTLTEGGRVLTISDAGASIAPGDGCASVGPSEVRCIAPAGATIAPLVTVALGDGDDVLGVFGGERSVAIDAGPGADPLRSREEKQPAARATTCCGHPALMHPSTADPDRTPAGRQRW